MYGNNNITHQTPSAFRNWNHNCITSFYLQTCLEQILLPLPIRWVTHDRFKTLGIAQASSLTTLICWTHLNASRQDMHVHAEHQTYTAPSLDPAKQWLPPAPHSSAVSWFRRKNWRWHKSCTLLRQPKNAKPLSGEGPLLVWNAMAERGCTASQWECMGLSLHMVDDCMNTTNSIFAKDWHQYHFRGLKIGHALVDASFKFHQQVIKSLMIDSWECGGWTNSYLHPSSAYWSWNPAWSGTDQKSCGHSGVAFPCPWKKTCHGDCWAFLGLSEICLLFTAPLKP